MSPGYLQAIPVMAIGPDFSGIANSPARRNFTSAPRYLVASRFA
jgi:hypothetical protein